MEKIRLCLGQYAKIPYEPEHMGIRVYCLEELCYFIKENACILEQGLMAEELAKWLETECGLTDLGEEIRKAVNRKISLKAFVGILLSYAGFFNEETAKEILQIIVDNDSLSSYEKRKTKADMLLEKGKYGLAGREYRKLLISLPEEEVLLRGAVYHSCGVALGRMFLFSMAGEYFLKAYELTGKIESYRQYLWTKRLSMTETEYVAFLQEHPEGYEDSLEMEDTLEALQEQWKGTGYAAMLSSYRKEKQGSIGIYENRLGERVEYLKDAYREMADTGKNKE